KEARDDEEDIDADEPARKPREAGVVEDDRHDRDRPQSIDVGAIAQVIGGAFAGRCRTEIFGFVQDGHATAHAPSVMYPVAKLSRMNNFLRPRSQHQQGSRARKAWISLARGPVRPLLIIVNLGTAKMADICFLTAG